MCVCVPGFAFYGCLLFLIGWLGEGKRRGFRKKEHVSEVQGNLSAALLMCPCRWHSEFLLWFEGLLSKFVCWKLIPQVHLLMVTGREAFGR